MRFGVVVYSNNPGTILNAFSLASHALKEGDKVTVSLLGNGVEIGTLSKEEGYAGRVVEIEEAMKAFVEAGGQLLASENCLKERGLDIPALCSLSSIEEMYSVIKTSDKVVTF